MDNEQREKLMMADAEAYAAEIYIDEPDDFSKDEQLCETINNFCAGWRAADQHTQWYDAQGDNLPDYGKEVIVLEKIEGGSFRVCFGHRPNPKEYVVVDGEKYYAQTYGKGWNLPNLAWWLDVELPEGVE